MGSEPAIHGCSLNIVVARKTLLVALKSRPPLTDKAIRRFGQRGREYG